MSLPNKSLLSLDFFVCRVFLPPSFFSSPNWALPARGSIPPNMGTAPASCFFCGGGGFFSGAGVEKRSSSETSLSNNPLDFGVGFKWLFVSDFGGGPPLFPCNGSLNKSSSSSERKKERKKWFCCRRFWSCGGSGDRFRWHERERVTHGGVCGLHKRVDERRNKLEEGRKVGERKHIGGERN